MDPSLFHLDWARTFEAIGGIIVLSILVERSLAAIFESRLFITYLDRSMVKEVTAAITAIAVCWYCKFDIVSILLLREEVVTFGFIISGMVVAGGAKASIKFFHDVLEIKSAAYQQRNEIRAGTTAARAEKVAAKATQAIDPHDRRKYTDKAVKLVALSQKYADETLSAEAQTAAASAEVATRPLMYINPANTPPIPISEADSAEGS